jgi:hypothetical protein
VHDVLPAVRISGTEDMSFVERMGVCLIRKNDVVD